MEAGFLRRGRSARNHGRQVELLRKALERDPMLNLVVREGLKSEISLIKRDIEAMGSNPALTRLKRKMAVRGLGEGIDKTIITYLALKLFEEKWRHNRLGVHASRPAPPIQQQNLNPATAKAEVRIVQGSERHRTPMVSEAWLSRSAQYIDYDWLKPTVDRLLSDEYRKKLLARNLSYSEALSIYSLLLIAWVDSQQHSPGAARLEESMESLSREIRDISGIANAVIAGRKALRLYAMAMSNSDLKSTRLNQQEREFLCFEPSDDSQLLENTYMWDHIYTLLLISAEMIESGIRIPPYPLGIEEDTINRGNMTASRPQGEARVR